MIRHVFISLPVADVERSRRFFDALGLPFDPAFGGADAACLQLGEHVRVMLLAHAVFEAFAHKPIPDPMATTQHLLSPVVDTREAVDELHRRALEAGATGGGDAEDHGYMYQQAFHDLDGHPWAITWFDPARAPGQA